MLMLLTEHVCPVQQHSSLIFNGFWTTEELYDTDEYDPHEIYKQIEDNRTSPALFSKYTMYS